MESDRDRPERAKKPRKDARPTMGERAPDHTPESPKTLASPSSSEPTGRPAKSSPGRVPCNGCGRALGDHEQPEIDACAGAVRHLRQATPIAQLEDVSRALCAACGRGVADHTMFDLARCVAALSSTAPHHHRKIADRLLNDVREAEEFIASARSKVDDLWAWLREMSDALPGGDAPGDEEVSRTIFDLLQALRAAEHHLGDIFSVATHRIPHGKERAA